MIKQVYVVIRADGTVRAAKRPRLASDEIAIKLNITMPAGWGRTTQTFDITMPDVPEATEVEPTP